MQRSKRVTELTSVTASSDTNVGIEIPFVTMMNKMSVFTDKTVNSLLESPSASADVRSSTKTGIPSKFEISVSLYRICIYCPVAGFLKRAQSPIKEIRFNQIFFNDPIEDYGMNSTVATLDFPPWVGDLSFIR